MRKRGDEWREATAASCHAEVATKAEARRAPVLRSSKAKEGGKPGLSRHSIATADGFGGVSPGFAIDAPPCGRGTPLL